MPKKENREVNAASAIAAAAVADRRHPCETDRLVRRGAVFPAMGDWDMAAFNAVTMSGPSGDFHSDERREMVRYRAVALFFEYDPGAGEPFAAFLRRMMPSVRRGGAFA